MEFKIKNIIGWSLVLVGGIMTLSSVSSMNAYTQPNYVAPAVGVLLVGGGLVLAFHKENGAVTIS